MGLLGLQELDWLEGNISNSVPPSLWNMMYEKLSHKVILIPWDLSLSCIDSCTLQDYVCTIGRGSRQEEKVTGISLLLEGKDNRLITMTTDLAVIVSFFLCHCHDWGPKSSFSNHKALHHYGDGHVTSARNKFTMREHIIFWTRMCAPSDHSVWWWVLVESQT